MKGKECSSELDGMEMISFGIVAMAGDARARSFEALAAAKRDEFDEADDLLRSAENAMLKAHHQQTELLAREAGGEHAPVDVLLVHAQDHLMTAMLAQELIRELVDLYRSIYSLGLR